MIKQDEIVNVRKLDLDSEKSTENKIGSNFVVLVPDLSNVLENDTSLFVYQVSRLLKKHLLIISGGSSLGVAKARTDILKRLKGVYPDWLNGVQKIRALCLDSDIRVIDSPEKFVEQIKKADENNWNLVAPYRIPAFNIITEGLKFRYSIMKEVGEEGNGALLYQSLTGKEISELKPLDELPNCTAGLGFYYGDIFPDYKYHVDKNGEDISFFKENNIKLRYSDMSILHKKTLYL